jgi:hypothetical protein
VDVISSLDAPCGADALFAAVDDLAEYPSWLGIVTKAETTGAVNGDPGPAWTVDLRGRLGPLARSKRLRMVRTLHESPTRARFERREVDGRSHSTWRLDVLVERAKPDMPDDRDETAAATEDASRLTMHLYYGGSFGGSLLERMLRDEIDHSRPRLLAMLTAAHG